MEGLESVSEYWFHNYYRVLVIDSSSEYVVSVDVYRRGWLWSVDEESCLSDREYCLVYHRVDPAVLSDKLGDLASLVRRVEIVGVKARGRVEAVNVRYFLSRDRVLKYSDIEKLFYISWDLVGARLEAEELD